MGSPPLDMSQFLARHFSPELLAWRGLARLGPVFWVHGVWVSVWLIALDALLIDLESWRLLQLLILVEVGYTAWILVAIWRCSANATPFWGTLAQWLTFAWGTNAAFVLFFVEVELVLTHGAG